MYVPPAFKDEEVESIRATIRGARLANLVTATAEGPVATPLPLFLDEIGEALAIFTGPEAYVTPSWYATKQETGKVVPTWNYVAVHAYGPVEFFQEPERLLDVVTRLTNKHEGLRAKPWAVGDAPADFIAAQLRGIVGIRIPVVRFEGKRKMSQNRPESDRVGVAAGLAGSENPQDRQVAPLIPVSV
jgi:transcriptional regulator